MPARRAFRSLVVLAIVFASLSLVSPAFAIPAEINKSFSPTVIEPGAVSVLTIRFFNPNLFPLTNFSVTDNLPSGLFIAGTPGVTNDCGATVNAPANGTSIAISGGTIPAQVGLTPGSCTITVRVTSTQQGNLINTIEASTLTTAQGETNSTPASATLTVQNLADVVVSKSFSPNTIVVGQTATLIVNVRNADTLVTLTGVAVTDSLPANVTIAGAATVTNCGPGSASTTATSVSLTGATITPGATCAVSVPVTSTVSGLYDNAIGVGAVTTSQGTSNSSPASATLAVQPLELEKSFTPPSITAGGISRLRISFNNRSTTPYNGMSLTDLMPDGITVAATPNPATTCGGAVTTTSNSVTLAGGSLPAGSLNAPSTCFIEVDVTSVTAGTFTNFIPANTLQIAGLPNVSNGNTPSAPLAVSNPLTGSKAFAPPLIAIGDVSRLTITLNNPTGAAYTGVSVTDNLPSGVTVAAPPNEATSCGGGVATTATSFTLTGGTIPANGSCTIAVDVTSNGAATYNNVINPGAVQTAQGATNGAPITASLRVESNVSDVNRPVGSKSFSPSAITAGQVSTLTISIVAPGGPLTGVTYTDTLPAEITVASIPANPATGCGPGVTINAPVDGNVIQISGASIQGGSACDVQINVTSLVQGIHVNSIPVGGVTATDQNNATVSNVVPIGPATLSVQALTMSKSFAPDIVGPNGRSTATVQLFNYGQTALTGLSVKDNLPVGSGAILGLIVANPANASTTCVGGAVSAPPGGGVVTLSGGSIPAQVGGVPGSCTVSFDVVPQNHSGPYTSGSATNTVNTADVTTAQGVSPAAPASAQLNFTGVQITVNKDFNPLIVSVGQTSVLSVRLINPMAIPIVGAAFTDNMPTGMILATPPGEASTCGGVVTAASGGASFSFVGGTVPANGTCVVSVNVTSLVSGNLTNIIPTGGVTSFTGASNTQPAEASLTYLPSLTLSKVFSPQTIAAGGTSVLTLQITNPNPFPITGVNLTDNMPAAITVAAPLTTTTTCGGTVSATVGGSSVSLVNGLLSANQTCAFTVVVTSVTGGAHVNTIPQGAVRTTEGATNSVPVTDTLTVTGGQGGVASVGDFVWVDTNGNGVQDSGEGGLAGVTVNLFRSDGSPAGTTATNGLGNYSFTNVPPGDYYVEFVLPSGYTFSPQDAGSDNALDSDANPTNGRTATFTLVAGQNDLTWDAGLIGAAPASLGDFVWVDANGNGVQDAGENGLAGVTVNLYRADGVTLVSSDVTDPLGVYGFANLTPGDYIVGFVLPSGYTFSPQDAGGNDAQDSDANPTTGRTALVSLSPGENDLTVDAGLIGSSGLSLGDFVWYDSNGNGLQEAGEPGVAGVTVSLFRSDGSPVGTTVTDDLGRYLFLNLTPGDYYVEFTSPAGYTFSPQNGGDSALDSNPDPATGRTAIVSLVEGNDLTIDAGLIGGPLASLGDFVWEDGNGNGAQDAGEPGIAGVTVRLYTSGGQLVGQTTTNSSGQYAFTNLAPGSYVVEFVPPGGYTFSAAGQGGNTALDSDANPANGRTAAITLAGGESNVTVDAGLQRTAVQNTPVPPPAGPVAAVSLFDPALSKVGVLESGALGLPGEQLTWLFTITNIGGATGTNIVLSDTLRSELRVDSADTDRGTVAVSGQTVTFNIPSLAPGETIRARVRTTVLSRPDGGVIVNEGVLTGTGSGGEQVRRVATAQITPPGALPSTGYAPPEPDGASGALIVGALIVGALALIGALLGGWLAQRRRRAR